MAARWIAKTMFFVGLIGGLLIPVFSWAQGTSTPSLIEGAKKERQLVYYTTMTLDQSKQTVDQFEKKYPFLKVTLFRTGGGPILNKILTEARGGRYDWDVVVGRGEMVTPLMERKLLASYHSPESKMIDAQLVDDQGYWTAYYVNSYVLGWNTKLVRREDVPKTYDALLNPKWKGQISLDTEAYGMVEGLKRAWGKEKALAYFKKLAALDPVLKRGNTERVQLVVAGEYPLIIAYNQTIQRMTSRGAPIDWIPLEPAVTQVNPAMIAAKSPHPNAARLFYDYILSRDGQEQLRSYQRIPVRKDVEPDPSKLFRGFKYVIENPEDYKDFDATVKQYLEIFKLR